jgi:hypothetical protein
MGVFAVWIELPNDVTVQRSQDANPGMPQEVPAFMAPIRQWMAVPRRSD